MRTPARAERAIEKPGTMKDDTKPIDKAYHNRSFLDSREARSLRILAEYHHPEARFNQLRISDTIVFWGSARFVARDVAERLLREAETGGGDVAAARRLLATSRYYEECRELARRLTVWSKGLEDKRGRFVVCTGGGPGIMEAANRGASEAKGLNIGLTISLPRELRGNPYITRQLEFEFHYFFMRKFWFVYLAKALVAFPGGFGTMDEFFELMTLIQTGKLRKRIPVILYGREYWSRVLNLQAMVEFGTIDAEDLELMFTCDTVGDAFDTIVRELTASALDDPGGRM